jgi:hypothetical protein
VLLYAITNVSLAAGYCRVLRVAHFAFSLAACYSFVLISQLFISNALSECDQSFAVQCTVIGFDKMCKQRHNSVFDSLPSLEPP